MCKSISKSWGRDGDCPGSKDGRHSYSHNHWAYYNFKDEQEERYWRSEHVDETNKMYWRHYEFMSLPCVYCGAYSPIRCQNMFGGPESRPCSSDQIKNYHPDDGELPEIFGTYSENGWFYIFFKETMSDSLDGQETFRVGPPSSKEQHSRVNTIWSQVTTGVLERVGNILWFHSNKSAD